MISLKAPVEPIVRSRAGPMGSGVPVGPGEPDDVGAGDGVIEGAGVELGEPRYVLETFTRFPVVVPATVTF